MKFPAEKRMFSHLNMHILMLLLPLLTVRAQSPSSQIGVTSGDSVANFQPSLAVVIGIFSIMFSVAFSLLVYAKCCHHQGSSVQNQVLTRSRSRFSGIDKKVIESLPFFRFSALKGSREGLECAVCLSKFEEIEILRLLPKCKHAFHIDCVDQWLEKHSSCPLCRHKVSADDVTFFTHSNSWRFLQSQSEMRDDSNLELFVQREESHRHGSSRFSRGSSFRSRNEEELPIQENDEEGREIWHKFNHKIVVSDVVLKNRWSSVSSSDLMFLNSEMINAMSSSRFFSKEPENEQFVTTIEVEDDAELVKIKEMGRERVFENKLSKIPISGHSNAQNPNSHLGNSSFNLNSIEKRSMSEIIVHPRFKEESAFPESNVEEERTRGIWLPIASKTIQWFANRESGSPHHSQNTRKSLNV